MSLLFPWDRFIKPGIIFLIVEVLVLKILFHFFFDKFFLYFLSAELL